MALDFYSVFDKNFKNILFQLDDGDFNALEGVLNEYYKKTGLYLDPYADSHVSYGHIHLIIGLIDSISINSRQSNNQLMDIKKKFESATGDLVALGD